MKRDQGSLNKKKSFFQNETAVTRLWNGEKVEPMPAYLSAAGTFWIYCLYWSYGSLSAIRLEGCAECIVSLIWLQWRARQVLERVPQKYSIITRARGNVTLNLTRPENVTKQIQVSKKNGEKNTFDTKTRINTKSILVVNAVRGEIVFV